MASELMYIKKTTFPEKAPLALRCIHFTCLDSNIVTMNATIARGGAFLAPSFWEQEYQRSLAYDRALDVVERLRRKSLSEIDDNHLILTLFYFRNQMISTVPGARFLFEKGIPQNSQGLSESEYEWVVERYLQSHQPVDVGISDWLVLCYMIGLEAELKQVFHDYLPMTPPEGSLRELWAQCIKKLIG